MHPTIASVTQRVIARSSASRKAYIERMQQAAKQGPQRSTLSCGNLAHGYAACQPQDKQILKLSTQADVAIVSAYNDMLSAHQPLEKYPALIKDAVRELGSVAQFAGGVPAMCDGVTQGQPGMELSLFSRDVIAMATAISLSHNMFDATLCLGVCDKIVPGLLIGALSFGHLPCIFVPAGPMPSGLPNKEKARVRQLYAEGKVGREALLEAESKSYHSSGTCTFYGTANSNQLLIEIMGLHLPGASFVNPETSLRDELTCEAARQVTRITALTENYIPMWKVVSEKSIINAVVALLATGGSTNHTMHLIAIARAAGIQITWDDFAELSTVVPLLTRIYPNGQADINHFQAAGGMAFLIRTLLQSGLLHHDVDTVIGKGLDAYTQEPVLKNNKLIWRSGPEESHDLEVLRSVSEPFSAEGGLRLLKGNLGRGVIKVSAVAQEHQVVEAPAIIFHSQEAMAEAFQRGELNQDCIIVVRFQGPQATGMPELHKLTPFLGVLQDKGYKVALVTDGRMSGASGKVPAAIHVYPEAAQGGPLAKLKNGDIVCLNAELGELTVNVSTEEWQQRTPVVADLSDFHHGMGRELFTQMRQVVGGAEFGATVFDFDIEGK
ncbi:phosphogluconate dehydratase [Zooshikella sp. RANM57]|uniref:phosphogluconate dehydratase n=1 Tax=Zooshikella sp. RANM57 TaxID=3425863 RepID=UPI003D6DFB23